MSRHLLIERRFYMLHFSNSASQLKVRAASLFALAAIGLLVSGASAADLDFNVASGNFNTAGNWIDVTNPIPVPTAATPTILDRAYVRNGGTVTINSDVAAL